MRVAAGAAWPGRVVPVGCLAESLAASCWGSPLAAGSEPRPARRPVGPPLSMAGASLAAVRALGLCLSRERRVPGWARAAGASGRRWATRRVTQSPPHWAGRHAAARAPPSAPPPAPTPAHSSPGHAPHTGDHAASRGSIKHVVCCCAALGGRGAPAASRGTCPPLSALPTPASTPPFMTSPRGPATPPVLSGSSSKKVMQCPSAPCRPLPRSAPAQAPHSCPMKPFKSPPPAGSSRCPARDKPRGRWPRASGWRARGGWSRGALNTMWLLSGVPRPSVARRGVTSSL